MTPTPLFWLTALAIVALALAALLWPLLRRHARDDAAPETLTAATAVYRDQKRQIDADLGAGAIGADEHQAALDELASRLGAEMELPGDVASVAPSRAPWVAALALVAIVPVAAVVGYLVLGSPTALSPQPTAATGATAGAAGAAGGASGASEEQLRAMVESLAQKMAANPADPRGWMLLARSYSTFGRYSEAADAYAKAAERLPAPDAQLFADWADVAAMAQGRKLAGAPEALVERALAVDPRNPKALALSGTAKLERGDLPGSLRQWRALRALLPNDSENAREVDTVLAQLEGSGGRMPAAPAATAPAATAPANALASSPAPAPAGSAAASTIAVTGRVELDPKIAGKVGPDDTVFVLARAVEGPRMPLAVQRFRAAELPRAFRLDDSMSMAPGMKLSTTPKVVVEARVSKSGNAITQPGDVRGVSAPLAPGAADVRVVIGDVVP